MVLFIGLLLLKLFFNDFRRCMGCVVLFFAALHRVLGCGIQFFYALRWAVRSLDFRNEMEWGLSAADAHENDVE